MAKENCSMCGGKGYYCEFSTLETCWCVEPATKSDEVSELRAEVDKLKRLIAERWKPELQLFKDANRALSESNTRRRNRNALLKEENENLRHLCKCALQYGISQTLRMQICTALEDQRHG